MSCIVGLLLTLHFFRPPAGGLWSQVFFNSLHVPIFGLIAVFIFLIAYTPSSWKRSAVIALTVASSLGVLSEAAQVFTSRDASWHDLIADFVGAASFLAIYLAVRPVQELSSTRRLALLGIAVLALGWVLAPLATTSAAYIERLAQFPTIMRFDNRFGRMLTRVQNADYQIIKARQNERAHAFVTLHNKPWPGVAFHDVQPNWEEFATLVIDLAIDGDAAFQVSVRVHDRAHETSNQYTDRFSRSFELHPGPHSLRIPIIDLANAPRHRSMDLARISELIIFSDASSAGRSLKLYEIRLE